MTKELRNLRLRQLDSVLEAWRALDPKRMPPHGWILAIREALGMSLAQFSRRVGVGIASAKRLEEREAAGTITLETLRKAAKALGCELVYALVPFSGSLESTLTAQARAAARDRIARVAHTMKLEEQGVNADELGKQEEELANQLRQDWSRQLWESRSESRG